jgi:DinB superfamily
MRRVKKARRPARRASKPKLARRTAKAKPARARVSDGALRKHVIDLLTASGAHVDFDDAVKDLPPALRGIVPSGAAHSAWQIVEHLRICQWDILEFSRNPKHVSPEWPAGYWPTDPAPPDSNAWDASLATFRTDLAAMARLVASPTRDLLAVVNHPGAKAKHTLLREAFVLADHNAYHIGELVLLRRLLGGWTG